MFKSFSSIWAKKESSYGVDSVPTKAANAILAGPVEIEPVFKKLERLNLKQYLGNRPAANVGEQVKVSFETEVKGSGDSTPDTPPEIGVLFVGCGMAETIDLACASASLTFVAATKKITRGVGSFVTDGIKAGDVITTDSLTNPGPFTVSTVSALELVVAETVADDGPAATVITVKKVVYTPDDNIEGSSITLYAYQHNHLYKVTGCRGTWSLDGKSSEFAKIKWEFQGIYAGPTDDTMPTDSTYNATKPPAFKAAGFSLGAFAGTIDNFKLAYGNEIARRPDANAATGTLAYFIKERKVTAQIDPEALALSSFNPVDLITAGTEQALSVKIGTAAGNRMRIDCPKVVVDTAKYAERENILTWDGSLLVCPSAGEDDVTVTFN